MVVGHWLGLDFGTSSVKALLVAATGIVKARATMTYPSLHGSGGEAEQDPQDYLDAARRAIATCGASEVKLNGIGLAGQTPTLVLVGANGEAVRPALTWQDQRAAPEAQLLEGEFGSSERLFGTNLPWTAAYPPAKLLWLAQNEPRSVLRTRWILQPKDFVGLRMTGCELSDPWSSKGICNIQTRKPAEELLHRVGWGTTVAPPLRQAWEQRGTITKRAAAEFGLPEGTPVAVGWSDALAAMLALGAFDEPIGFAISGTSSIVGMSVTGAVHSQPRLFYVPATCAPLGVLYGPTESSGASVEWLARLLRCEPREVLMLAASRPTSREAPVFVPYLAGERAPIWRTDVRSVLLGISVHDGPAELARAVVEGVCLSERHVLSVAEEYLGTTADEVGVAGRGVSEPPWHEARLAVLARPVRLLGEPDASALGAAMLAAAAASGGDLSAVRALRGELRTTSPSESDRESAERRFNAYRRAVDASLGWADNTS
jgi:xylulokinase